MLHYVTCLDLPSSNFCRLIAWFSWAKLILPAVLFTFVSLIIWVDYPISTWHTQLPNRTQEKRKCTYLFALDGLTFLTCDDCKWPFDFRADGFLTKLAIFLAVWCFLESVTEASFFEVINGIGVQASFSVWPLDLIISVTSFEPFLALEEATFPTKALSSAQMNTNSKDQEFKYQKLILLHSWVIKTRPSVQQTFHFLEYPCCFLYLRLSNSQEKPG